MVISCRHGAHLAEGAVAQLLVGAVTVLLQAHIFRLYQRILPDLVWEAACIAASPSLHSLANLRTKGPIPSYFLNYVAVQECHQVIVPLQSACTRNLPSHSLTSATRLLPSCH